MWAAFTLGYDHDTPESIARTVEFAIENKFCFAAFNILMPYPGTPLYETLRAEGRLLYDGKWWLHPDYRFNYAAFRPKRMSPDELTEACFQARRRFNSVGSILRRALRLADQSAEPVSLGAVTCATTPCFVARRSRSKGCGWERTEITDREILRAVLGPEVHCMRVTLIYPAVGRKPGRPYVRSWQMEPLSMALLASLTPPDVDLRFYDDRLEDIPFDEPTDLVAMSVETFTALART